MFRNFFLVLLLAGFLLGCGMLGAWKSIPPPGGCDKCHTLPISNNWQVAYQTVTLTDETGRHPWQKSTSMLPEETPPLEQKKLTEQRCFRCHKGPNKAHIDRVGTYHH